MQDLTPTQAINLLTPDQRTRLVAYFISAYDDGYRPHIHTPEPLKELRAHLDRVRLF